MASIKWKMFCFIGAIELIMYLGRIKIEMVQFVFTIVAEFICLETILYLPEWWLA